MISRTRQARAALATLGTVAIAAAAAAGCGSSDDESTSSATNAAGAATTTADAGGTKVDVAYMTYALTDYVQAEVAGVEAKVKPAGGSVKVFNANFDPQKQNQQCQDAITSGRYDAIVLSPVDPATGTPCVRAAAGAGIPVATIEQAVGPDPYSIEPQLDGVVAVASIPLQSQVEKTSGLVQQACADADPCKVIAEVATPSDRFTNDVVKGVEEQLPNVEIVQTVAGQYDPSVIAKAIPDVLAANADADVFLSAADSQAIASFPAIEGAGMSDSLKVIGNGGSRAGAKAVAAETLFGTVGNWPFQAGELLAAGLMEAVGDKPVTQPSIDILKVDEPALITKETVEQFKPEWGAE